MYGEEETQFSRLHTDNVVAEICRRKLFKGIVSEDTKIFHWAKFFAFKHGMKLVSDVQENFISLYIEVY